MRSNDPSPFFLHPRSTEWLAPDLVSIRQRPTAAQLGQFGQGCGALLLFLFVLAGAFAAAFAAHEWRMWWVLHDRGVDGIATVVELTTHEDEGTKYHVRYRVGDPPAEVRQQVKEAHWRSLRVGSPIEVRYAPDDPSIARVRGESFAALRWVVTLFALVWNACVWPMWLLMLGQAWRTRQLVVHGTLRRGRLLTASAHRDSDGDTLLKVAYAFEDPVGRELRGETQLILRKGQTEPSLPPAGTPIRVLWVDDQVHRAL